MRWKRSFLAGLLAAWSLPARPGVVLLVEDGEGKRTTVEIDGRKMRADAGEQGEHTTIFDGDKKVFFTIDEAKKTYRRMDERSAAEMGERMKAQMDQAKAKMTPEQRAQLEAMMAGRGQGQAAKAPRREHAWTFERTSGGSRVAGHACQNYRVLKDAKPESEGCFIPWGSGLEKKELQVLGEMGAFMERMVGAMTEHMGRSGRRGGDGAWLMQWIDKAPGFPAVLDDLDDHGKRTRETKLVKIERTSVAASRFDPPSGYREVRMDMDKDD